MGIEQKRGEVKQRIKKRGDRLGQGVIALKGGGGGGMEPPYEISLNLTKIL